MSEAGYSGTPLPRKLGMGPGHRVAFPGAPDGFAGRFDGVGVDRRERLRFPLDVIVLFATSAAGLRRRFPAAKRALAFDGGLWVAWPKRSSGVPTDLSFDAVQPVGLDAGLVDNKVCAIDEVWSALRFVYRVEDRPGGTRRPVREAPGR